MAASGRVFVSHSSVDANVALALAEALDGAGFASWIAPRDIPAGANFMDAIMSAVRDCGAVVLLLSQAAIESPHVQTELTLAMAQRRSIFVFSTSSATHRYADLPDRWQYLLAACQVTPLAHPTAAAAAVAAGLGTDVRSDTDAEPGIDTPSVPTLEATQSPAALADSHPTVLESLQELRVRPEIAALVNSVSAGAGLHHDYVASSRYIALRQAPGKPVTAYIKRSSLSLPLAEGQAAELLAGGVGVMERIQGHRHYVKIKADELVSPDTLARVRGIVTSSAAHAELAN